MVAAQELGEDVFAIHEAFAATVHGEVLADKIRYEKYNLAHLTNEEWVGLLGSDVNNLTHMPLTCGLAKSFIHETERIGYPRLDEAEQLLLQVAAIIHDQGESIVGDISFGDKTEADEVEERLQFERNLEAFCPGASFEMKKVIIQARDEVAFDATTKLGRIFNAIERVGYVRTALRASSHAQNETISVATPGLRWIVADVFSNQPVKLIEYTSDYPAVRNYLLAQQDKIKVAFNLVRPEDFDNYVTNAETKRTQFNEGFAAWQHWLQNVDASCK